MKYLSLVSLVIILFISSCKPESKDSVSHEKVYENGYELIQEMLIDAVPGSTIDIPEGLYKINRSISLDGISRVTIKGAGKENTILSFLEQDSGAEGLRITADSITLEGFTVADAIGDLLNYKIVKV